MHDDKLEGFSSVVLLAAVLHVAYIYIYVASCIVQAHAVALAGHQQLKVTQSSLQWLVCDSLIWRTRPR